MEIKTPYGVRVSIDMDQMEIQIGEQAPSVLLWDEWRDLVIYSKVAAAAIGWEAPE